MKKIYSCISIITLSMLLYQKGNAQACSPTVSNGQNLVTNSDFSQAYTGWTFQSPAYTQFTPCGSSCYSVPGKIYAGDKSTDFNQAFNMGTGVNIPDHTATSDNMMLMCDGVCTAGIDVWKETNIPISANTNYYFTVWMAPMTAGGVTQATLQFVINGTALPTNITPGSSAVVGQWTQFTYVWNSGLTPPATATIEIQNTTTTGCNNGVDFALDDISFTPGCQFGSPGPSPDLGPDFTICGKSTPFNINPNFNAATAAANNLTYNWYKNGVLQPGNSGLGSSFYNYSVSGPGTYSVCVDSAGSCPKTDVLVISNTFSINLGPDLILCNPTTATLDAGYTGPGVTYQWSVNGNPISGATSKTLSVTTPGNYSVAVTDPICGTQSDNVVITTNAATPVDGTFCPVASGGSGIANLSVSGAGKYKWWTAASGGTTVATGNSYSTSALAGPGPYTYYVEDTSTFSLTVGPPATGNGFTNVASTTTGDTKNLLVFNALTTFKLDSITVLPYNYYCPGPYPSASGNANVINIIIYDANGNVVGTSNYSAQCTGTGTPAPPLRVPVGINIPQGDGYQMRLNTGSTNIALYLNTTNGGNTPSPELYHYPTSYSSAVEFVTNSSKDFNLYYSPDAIPGYFDWKITKGINCQRVPVTATLSCPPPPSCTTSVAPVSVSVDNPNFCASTTTQITLTANGGSGTNLVWYSGSCGSATIVGQNTDGAPITISAPSVATTYYARWETSGCNSTCLSVMATPVQPPSAASTGSNLNLCNVTSTTINATAPAVGTGRWSVVSGTGVITDVTSAVTTVTGLIPAANLTLKWKVTNSPCPADSTNMNIHVDTLTAPSFSSTGAAFDTCANTPGVTYLTQLNHPANTYNWTVSGSLSITSQSNNTVTVNTGNSGGTLSLTEINGACSLSTSAPITIKPPVSNASAGIDRDICINKINLNAILPSVGSGKWSITSGSGTFVNVFDPKSVISNLGNGINTLTWTISGCGGPLTDDVNIVVGASGMALQIAGPGDTMCVGFARTLNTTIVGGSGKFNYYWFSSDSSFKTTTSTSSTIVAPPAIYMKYYVYAVDILNTGCNSNVDSAIVSSVTHQELTIPNLITPNGDLHNDDLIIKGIDNSKLLPDASLEIVNGWGAVVYKNTNYDNQWKADQTVDGVYYYYLKTGCGQAVYKGWLQITR